MTLHPTTKQGDPDSCSTPGVFDAAQICLTDESADWRGCQRKEVNTQWYPLRS